MEWEFAIMQETNLNQFALRTMCCQRVMNLNQYGQNLVLLDQDEVGVFSTFCLRFVSTKKLRLINMYIFLCCS